MAASAILKFSLSAIARSLLHIFAQNLAYTLKLTFYFQLSLLTKSNTAATAILDFCLTAAI